MRSFRSSALTLVVALMLLAAASAAPGATPGATPSAKAKTRAEPVTIATLNLLHGLFCPEDTDRCQTPGAAPDDLGARRRTSPRAR
jgi:hypothetical protein